MTIETLRIEYPTGYLYINVESFFPCTVQKANKVLRLALRYCSDEHLDDLHETLKLKGKRLLTKEKELEERRLQAPIRSTERKDVSIQIKRIKRERAMLERNAIDLDIMRRKAK